MEKSKLMFGLMLGLLLLGCTMPGQEAQTEGNETIIASETPAQVPTPEPPTTSQLPPAAEQPANEIETKSYTDPSRRISFEYPITWKIRSTLGIGIGGHAIELSPSELQYSDDKILIAYGQSTTTLENEEEALEKNGIAVQRISINGRTFIVYESEFEPTIGRVVKERIAMAVKEGNLYRIKLTASARDFDDLLPDYELILNSVRLL